MASEGEKWDAFLDAWQEIKDRLDAYERWSETALKHIKPKEKAQQLKNQLEDIKNG